MAHGHDGRYGQVFRNVIDNALSFSPPNSRIVIELTPRAARRAVRRHHRRRGPGIPDDNLESIFQRFYSERPTEHFGQHSGLGLSICRQIMETYGGSISASNRRAADGGYRARASPSGCRPQRPSNVRARHLRRLAAPERLARRAAARPVGRGQIRPGAAPDRGGAAWWPTTRPPGTPGAAPDRDAAALARRLIEARGVGIVKLPRGKLAAGRRLPCWSIWCPAKRSNALPEPRTR
jgi:hypothetical protein